MALIFFPDILSSQCQGTIILLNTMLYFFPQDTGKTALHIASSNGSIECVRALLEYRANVDLLDKDGKHAAHGYVSGV